MQPTHEPEPAVLPAATGNGDMRLVTALVDHDDPDELREALIQAGASSLVLSEASVYGVNPRTEVIRGHRRTVEFAPRLRLEVLVDEPSVPHVVDAPQALPGASQYVHSARSRLAATVAARAAD